MKLLSNSIPQQYLSLNSMDVKVYMYRSLLASIQSCVFCIVLLIVPRVSLYAPLIVLYVITNQSKPNVTTVVSHGIESIAAVFIKTKTAIIMF